MNIEIERTQKEVSRLEKLLVKTKHRLYSLKQKDAIRKSGRLIYNYRNFKERPLNKEKAYEVKGLYWDTGTFNHNSLSNMFIWVCEFCKTPLRRKNINVGNHRDYSYNVCDCKEAAKYGKRYQDLD